MESDRLLAEDNNLRNKETKKVPYGLLLGNLDPLIKDAEKSKGEKQISNPEIFAYFPDEHLPTQNFARFSTTLQNLSKKRSQPPDLWDGLKSFYLRRLILLVVTRILISIITVSMPFVMDRMSDLFKSHQSGEPFSKGDRLNIFGISGFVCIYGVAMLWGKAFWDWERTKLNFELKSILSIVVYRKLLVKKDYAERKVEGQQHSELPDVNNLMVTDMDEVTNFIEGLCQICAITFEFCVYLYILYSKIGGKILLALVVILTILVIYLYFNKYLGSMFGVLAGRKDDRLSPTRDVLYGVKALKFLGWEQFFLNRLQSLRDREFAQLRKLLLLVVISRLIWQCAAVILTSFIIYSLIINEDKEAVAQINLITIMYISTMLIGPFLQIPWCFTMCTNGQVSFRRICSYLEAKPTEEVAFKDHPNKNLGAVEFVSLQTTWPRDNGASEFKVEATDLKIDPGSLNFLVGKVGSGKTGLLLSLLNEMETINCASVSRENLLDLIRSFLKSEFDPLPRLQDEQARKQKAQVYLHEHVSYAAQNFWLQNKSVRENILFGSAFDPERYSACLDACQLRVEVAQMKGRDDYVVGPDGNNLSGGQRQRIALCRAIYAEADIYLLDDVLSAVDPQVADALVEQAIIGYLKRRGKTVIMSLSQERYFHLADNLLLIENGKLSRISLEAYSFSDSRFKDIKMKTKQSETAPEAITHPTGNLEEAKKNVEEREEGQVKSATVLLYFKKVGWISFLLSVIFIIGSEVIRRLFEFWMQSYIKAVNHNDFSELLFIIISEGNTILVLISIYAFLFFFGMTLLMINHLRAVRLIFNEFHYKILFSRMSFFDRTPVGRIVNRYSEDTFKIDFELPQNLHTISLAWYIFLTTYIGLIILMPWFIPAICIGVIFVYYFQDKYRQANREIQRLLLINNSIFTNHITESLSGVRTIRAFKREEEFLREFEEALTNKVATGFVSQALFYWVTFRVAVISYLLLITVVITCCVAVLYNYNLDYTKICLGLMYILSGLCFFESFVLHVGDLEKNFISVERLKQYLSNETEPLDESSSASHTIANQNTEAIVAFENVYLSYETEPTSDESNVKYALKDISFTINRGEKIAVCGRTGSGKSSILNVLFRFYQIQKGRVLFHGTPIDSLSLVDLRRRMSIIPQFGFLFKGSLRENIDPKGEFEVSAILDMFKKTSLRIRGVSGDSDTSPEQKSTTEDKIDLDFQLDNLGSNLSNGEKQIINFMRVFIHPQELVCLDEANSNVDAHTDAVLMKELFEICHDKSILMISHRLENLKLFDKIIVLDQGRIVEVGKFDDLIANDKSHFNVLRNNA